MTKRKAPPCHTRMIEEDTIPHKSQIKNPVQLVWQICEQHKTRYGENITQKRVINECLRKGVAFYTARTQYQRWRSAGNADLRQRLLKEHALRQQLANQPRKPANSGIR